MAKQNMGGVYANMEFKPYEWQEFPKHIIVGPHGKYEVAETAAEEASIRAKLQRDEDDAPPEVVPYVVDPEKEILISRANELGVAINRKWSKAKIKQTVEDAEGEVDDLPAEENSEEYKDKLIAEAKSLGINASRVWGIPRLKTMIAEAKS